MCPSFGLASLAGGPATTPWPAAPADLDPGKAARAYRTADDRAVIRTRVAASHPSCVAPQKASHGRVRSCAEVVSEWRGGTQRCSGDASEPSFDSHLSAPQPPHLARRAPPPNGSTASHASHLSLSVESNWLAWACQAGSASGGNVHGCGPRRTHRGAPGGWHQDTGCREEQSHLLRREAEVPCGLSVRSRLRTAGAAPHVRISVYTSHSPIVSSGPLRGGGFTERRETLRLLLVGLPSCAGCSEHCALKPSAVSSARCSPLVLYSSCHVDLRSTRGRSRDWSRLQRGALLA